MIPKGMCVRRLRTGPAIATVGAMDQRTVPVRRPGRPRRARPVPYLEPVLGAVWWTVGASALPGGAGTAVLAAGLGVAGWMVFTVRRNGSGAPLPPGGRGRLARLMGITLALVAVTATVLGATGWGELAVPVACAIVGVALLFGSSQLDERVLLAAGGALMVLGAAGALLALDSAGALYPQGVVGLVAGAVLWGAGAVRAGLLPALRR